MGSGDPRGAPPEAPGGPLRETRVLFDRCFIQEQMQTQDERSEGRVALTEHLTRFNGSKKMKSFLSSRFLLREKKVSQCRKIISNVSNKNKKSSSLSFFFLISIFLFQDTHIWNTLIFFLTFAFPGKTCL